MRAATATAASRSRWQVLGALADKAQPVAGIARDMGLARQSVQRTADLLAAEGVVEYVDNPAHRRAKLVRLTPLGEEVLAGISQEQAAWANRLAKAIQVGADEIRATVEVLRHLRSELEGENRHGEPHRRAHQSVRGRGGQRG